MKIKILATVLLAVLIAVFALNISTTSVNNEYLRLHIRANSNSEIDQNVKYEIKNIMVEYLTPMLCNVESKTKAIEIVESNKQTLINKCKTVLINKGFSYSVNIKINNEYFPTRTYSNTTLESGYYDAVIVELGSAQGDNWWCVMYPPLCFVNKNQESIQIKYKSRIVEWWDSLFN